MSVHKHLVYQKQKQTNLANSLLQDIAVFNEYDSTKLEEWLTDIETAADSTNENQAKLAKAKSRGLKHTLVSEAITFDKSWDKIKDLLWLKLCTAVVHTYTSCFMEIKQWEKESFAAYTHRFKIEAKRYNFTNNAATIRIFIKGLKNAHSLATCIYENGPQMLTDSISEVEKLNAIQQLAAMIIPPSTVNVTSHEEYHCFQGQGQGPVAQNCPHIRCYECDEYGHIVIDCPHKIPQQFITNLPEIAMPDQVQDTTIKKETVKADPDHNLTFENIAAWVITILTEVIQGHNTEIDAAIIGVAHNDCAPHIEATATDLTVTHHIDHTADHSHIEVLQPTNPGITVDHIPNHPTNLQGRTHTDQVCFPADHEENHTSRRMQW